MTQFKRCVLDLTNVGYRHSLNTGRICNIADRELTRVPESQ